MSNNTVRKYMCKLEERQFISTEGTTVTTKAGLKRNGNLLYTIHPIQLAMNQFYEQQLTQQLSVSESQRYSHSAVTACAPLCGLAGAQRVTSRSPSQAQPCPKRVASVRHPADLTQPKVADETRGRKKCRIKAGSRLCAPSQPHRPAERVDAFQ